MLLRSSWKQDLRRQASACSEHQVGAGAMCLLSAWYVPVSFGCFAPEYSPENEVDAWNHVICSLCPAFAYTVEEHTSNAVLSSIGVVEDSFTTGILQTLNTYQEKIFHIKVKKKKKNLLCQHCRFLFKIKTHMVRWNELRLSLQPLFNSLWMYDSYFRVILIAE